MRLVSVAVAILLACTSFAAIHDAFFFGPYPHAIGHHAPAIMGTPVVRVMPAPTP